MTDQLIPVVPGEIAGEKRDTVNARELHTFLELGRDFSNWMKKRIQEYGFAEGIDYVKKSNNSTTPNLALPESLDNLEHSRDRIDYYLTLDMAKELAMVERNDKGRQARQYFIECERAVRALRHDRTNELTRKAYALAEARYAEGMRRAMDVLARCKPASVAVYVALARYANLGLTPAECAKLLGRKRSTTTGDICRLRRLGLIMTAPQPCNLTAHNAARRGLEA